MVFPVGRLHEEKDPSRRFAAAIPDITVRLLGISWRYPDNEEIWEI